MFFLLALQGISSFIWAHGCVWFKLKVLSKGTTGVTMGTTEDEFDYASCANELTEAHEAQEAENEWYQKKLEDPFWPKCFKTMREMGLITTLWQDESAATASRLHFIIFN